MSTARQHNSKGNSTEGLSTPSLTAADAERGLRRFVHDAEVEPAEDSPEWARARLAALCRLGPARLVRRFLAEPTALALDEHFDSFDCAALFVDISGFSKLTELLFATKGLKGAEELASHLNHCLGRGVDRLVEAGGDVLKFAGDACLCGVEADGSPADLRAKALLAARLSLESIAQLEGENYEVGYFVLPVPLCLSCCLMCSAAVLLLFGCCSCGMLRLCCADVPALCCRWRGCGSRRTRASAWAPSRAS